MRIGLRRAIQKRNQKQVSSRINQRGRLKEGLT